MRTLILSLICSFTLFLSTPSIFAQKVTKDEAFNVAQNWITLILQKEGDWGGFKSAGVKDIQEFKRGQQVIGYFCRVWPKGYIITSLRKELAPIKAYSDTDDLDPLLEKGMTDLIKGKMQRILNKLETSIGTIPMPPDEKGRNISEFDFRASWGVLGQEITAFEKVMSNIVIPPNYSGGGSPLLSSAWHQGDPYNLLCPPPPSESDCTEPRCPVGCTALAGAQVMRYWAWPPGYDWVNMPNRVETDSSDVQKTAVASLCRAVGAYIGAKYCIEVTDPEVYSCQTGAFFAGALGSDLLDAFKDNLKFSDSANDRAREDEGAVDWFDRIKRNMNENRPLPYLITDHVIVCDGWKETPVGTSILRQYHMNYGWDSPDTAWYTLDDLYLGDKDIEEMIVQLKPATSLGSRLPDHSWLIPAPAILPHYLDQDTEGLDVRFFPGNNIQFLAGVSIKGLSLVVGDSVRFEGSTHLYSIKGTETGGIQAGIKINDGAIKLFNNGGIQMH